MNRLKPEQRFQIVQNEAHFWLNGYVNKQNCCIWSDDNAHVFVETPLHPEKLTVWCALWAGGIIGLYFFKNDAGQNVTVNEDRYRAMITDLLPSLLKDNWFIEGNVWYTHSFMLRTRELASKIVRFNAARLVSVRICEVAIPMSRNDYMEDNIRRVIADVRLKMLEEVIENWTCRLDYVRASHMPEVIFKL